MSDEARKESGQIIVELDVADAQGIVVARFHLVDDGEYCIGRDRETAHILIDDKSISRRHAIVRRRGLQIKIADAGSLNGTILAADQTREPDTITDDGALRWNEWPAGSEATVGIFTLVWRRIAAALAPGETAEPIITTLGADGDREPDPSIDQARRTDPQTVSSRATAELFGDETIVSLAALRERASVIGVPIDERDYLSIGGGLGSLAFVDHLRIFGVRSDAIRVIGQEAAPFAKWADRCVNAQFGPDKRLRSNSGSTPDNIWGFPGYALRETWQRLKLSRFDALRPVAQVFSEPLSGDSYAPRLIDATGSIQRECTRIGWAAMFETGHALALRKTDDGRYALAYRSDPVDQTAGAKPRHGLVIARHVHIATGYPGMRLLPVLQAYCRRYKDGTSVVNAHEPHDDIYRSLETVGGTVVLEGRGAIAAQVLQRIAQIRQRNPTVNVVHVMRYPILKGHVYDRARRATAHHVELQRLDWPKGVWSGTLRKRLERADPNERARLMELWGGVTTPPRRSWRAMLSKAEQQGWYRVAFGDLLAVKRLDGALALTLQPPVKADVINLQANYIIDCTGLVADVTASPFLADLIDIYGLPRNRAAATGQERGLAGLKVTTSFEIRALRHAAGTVHAAGVITANGAYAPVDSFLGLTYAALRSVEHLARIGAPNLRAIGPLGSFGGWMKWCLGAAP